jgi:hypothetical protein
MRWFKHFTDARNNPKFRTVERILGEAGYARAFKLFEIVAERGGKAEDFTPKIDLRELYTNIEWLADEWRIEIEDAEKTLETFASVGLIDLKSWRRKVVQVPQMLEYLDEWTERRLRPKPSRGTPERLPSDSRGTRARAETEKEKDKEKEAEAERDAAATAASLLDSNNPKAWNDVYLTPVGDIRFQRLWEEIYTRMPQTEFLGDAMERCILASRECGIHVPKSFYDSKHAMADSKCDKSD